MSRQPEKLLKRIRELDLQGYGKVLKEETRKVHEYEDDMGNWGPGGPSTSVSTTIRNGLMWLKGNGDSNEELEYEIEEPDEDVNSPDDVKLQSSDNASDPELTEEDDLLIQSTDPLVKEKVELIINPVRKNFTNQFKLNMSKIDSGDIGFLLEWVNHVTGSNLIVADESTPEEVIILSNNKFDNPKIKEPSSEETKTESVYTTDKEDTTSVMTSTTMGPSSDVHYLGAVKNYPKTSHMISIISQFSNGIKIPKKSGNKHLILRIGKDDLTENEINKRSSDDTGLPKNIF